MSSMVNVGIMCNPSASTNVFLESFVVHSKDPVLEHCQQKLLVVGAHLGSEEPDNVPKAASLDLIAPDVRVNFFKVVLKHKTILSRLDNYHHLINWDGTSKFETFEYER